MNVLSRVDSILYTHSARRLVWSPLRASSDHRFIVRALRAQRPYSPSLSESARLVKKCDSLAEEGLDLLKEQRDGTVLCNLGDERFRVVFQEPRDAGECLDEDLSHFLAM